MLVRWPAVAALLSALACSAVAAPVSLVSIGDASPLGRPFSRFSDVAIDDDGRVAFVGGSTVIFRRTGTGIVRLIGAGDVVRGLTLAGVDAPQVTIRDCMAFRATIVGSGAALMRRCGGTVDILAQTGDSPPGGGRFTSFGPNLAIGPDRVAFTALLPNGVTVLYQTLGGGAFTEIVRTGSPSPAGGLFTALRPIGISASGRIGFRGSVTNGPDGLFYWNGSAIAKLVVVGDSTPAGGSYTSVGLASLNAVDTWAFRASVSGQVGAGVFRVDTLPPVPLVQAVVLRGGPTPIGGTFADFPTSLIPAINDAGTIAFRATVADGSANSGVFLVSASGDVSTAVALRAKVGEERFLLRLREITLAEDGGVVVRATLDDGTPGLFLARAGEEQPQRLALLGDATDAGTGFRFTDASAREIASGAVFLGIAEAVFVGTSASDLEAVATLGDATPLGGTYAGVDPPAAGDRGRIVFGAGIQDGRVGEALFTVGRRRPKPTVRAGTKVGRVGRVIDLFADPLDDLARPSVGRGAVAFQAALTGGSAASGIFAKSTGPLRAVAVAGEGAPGGGRYRSFGTPAVMTARRIAFVAELNNPDTHAVILRRGRRHILLGRAGRDTGTRLGGAFFSFDTPVAGNGAIAFRAILQDRRDAIFFARGAQLDALAASPESEPSGGRFRTFGTPAIAGTDVIVGATTVGGPSPGGLYRISTETDAITALAPVGSPSPLGGTFLAFGTPTANKKGTIAYTADLLDATTATTIIVDGL